MSCGAEPGSSGGASGGPGDEKDKDMDSSHRVNEPEDKEYPEADTLTHSIPGDLDIFPNFPSFPASVPWPVSEGEKKRSDSESEGGIFVPRLVEPPIPQRPKYGRSRKNTNPISYSDLSYLNSLSRQEKRRIEGEIIKGLKLGEYDNRSTHDMFCIIKAQTMESQSLVSLNYTLCLFVVHFLDYC